MNRPSWDEYYMDMAFFIAQKSLDPSTKHGCIAVDEDHTVLSIGYNSPPRGCVDENIPLTRPAKYPYMVHSEENAIINAARSGVSLKGSTFYITGSPCSRCFRGILNVGAIRIVYGPVNSNCISEEDKQAIEIMNQSKIDLGECFSGIFGVDKKVKGEIKMYEQDGKHIYVAPKIEFCEYKGSIGKVLSQTQDYIKEKCKNEV